jgi:RNA polymerase sigma-70 factor
MTSRELFEILVREHADMLLVYLRTAVRDPTAVDDLFQETLIVAWRTLDRFDRERLFAPWLRGIAARLVLAYRRKSAAAPVVCDAAMLEHLDHRLTALSQRSGDTLDEKLDCLRDCLEKLPGEYREAVQLRYLNELPSETLAERLQLSMEALKKRLQRGRARLLDCLTRKLTVAGVES